MDEADDDNKLMLARMRQLPPFGVADVAVGVEGDVAVTLVLPSIVLVHFVGVDDTVVVVEVFSDKRSSS